LLSLVDGDRVDIEVAQQQSFADHRAAVDTATSR